MSGRHYPPSYHKYRRTHPTISVRLSEDFKKAFDAYRGDLSYAEALKRLLREKEELIRNRAGFEPLRQEALKAGYKRGFEKGYDEGIAIEHFTVTCSICGEPIEFTSEDRESWEEQMKPFLERCFAGASHLECQQQRASTQ